MSATLGIVDVESFAGAGEAWRCPHLTAEITGPGNEYYHAGTVMRLDGEAHAARRRSMGQLLKKRGHKYFRDRWLLPTAESALAEVLASPDADGVVRLDLLRWVRRVNQRLAAAITGFDGATSAEGSDELFALIDTVMLGRPSAITVTLGDFDVDTPVAQAALAARDEVVRRFYEPSLARRRELVAQVQAGSLAVEELPQDLLTLIALGTDPAWADPGVAQREAALLLGAGVHTTSMTMVWTLRELFVWLAAHPEQEDRLVDEQFLLQASQEAMRLHPVVPGFARLATADVDLADGTHVSQGSLAVIRGGSASVEAGVFGADALEFDPDREIPAGANRFGYAFGAGAHMCYGMPIVIGTDGMDGSLVHLLKRVLRAGVRPDPANLDTSESIAATRSVHSNAKGESYLVTFPATS